MPRTKQPSRKSAPKRKPSRSVQLPAPNVQSVEVVFDGGEWAGLTDKQRMFVEQYFICGLNGTEAAMAVYNCSTRDIAASMASDLLRLPKVRARVDARLDEFHMTANEVLARLAYHARGSMEDFIDPDSGTIDIKRAKEARALGLVKKFRTKFITGENSDTLETEVELYDQQAALVHIGKHHKLFGTDIEVNILAGRRLEDLTTDELAALAAGKSLPSRAGGA